MLPPDRGKIEKGKKKKPAMNKIRKKILKCICYRFSSKNSETCFRNYVKFFFLLCTFGIVLTTKMSEKSLIDKIIQRFNKTVFEVHEVKVLLFYPYS